MSTQEVGDIFGQGRGSAQAMLRSPTVLILCVGLWGMNLFFYRLFGLDYKYILRLDLIEIDQEEKEKKRKGRRRRTRSNDGRGMFEYSETGSTDSLSDDLELVVESSSGSVTPPRQRGTANPLVSPSASGGSSNSTADEGAGIVWYKLVLFSVILLFLLHFSTHYWMDHLHRSSIGAVFFFYASTLVYIFVPLRQNAWLRRSLRIVVQRTWALVHPRCSCITLAGTSIPPRRVPFVDVFYADAMCSLSKVFFDWGMLAHQAVHYPHPVPAATHNIVVPSLCAALPYLIRARQCLIMHTVGRLQRDPKKHHHLMNAFKYSTSMYPLILSAYLKTFAARDKHQTETLETVLTVLLVINASYSLYWDIVMDWGMMQDPYKVAQTACALGVPPVGVVDASGNDSSPKVRHKGHHFAPHHHGASSCHQVCLRPRLRYGLTLTALIVVADSFLRFSWTLKFVPHLFPSHDAFVLCTQFLEVFRRAIWNLLRVEWEHIKQSSKQHHPGESAPGSASVPLDLPPSSPGLLVSPPASLGSDHPPESSKDASSSLEMKILR